ncbi:MAG: hypothetical protein EBT99_17080, partial [Betaproteobacteria bacterium]|nr:hypothetical protein [Betaproteobacteria bacterium]
MPIIFANNAVSTLAASITSSALSFSVAAGDGNLFPLPLAGEYYLVTLTNTAGSIEIVKVTARTGDVMSLERGADQSSPRAWAAGDRVELRLTRAALGEFVQQGQLVTFEGR